MKWFTVSDFHGREYFALWPHEPPNKVDLKPVSYTHIEKVPDDLTLTDCVVLYRQMKEKKE